MPAKVQYTALLIAIDPSGSSESFTLSRPIETANKRKVFLFLQKEASVQASSMDTILLFKNGPSFPVVVKFWRAANGDFEDL